MSILSRKLSNNQQLDTQSITKSLEGEEQPSLELNNFPNLFDWAYSYDLTKYSGSTKVSSQFGNSYLVPYGSRIIRVKNNSKWVSFKSSNKNWFTAYIGASPATIINLLKASYSSVTRRTLLYTLDPRVALNLSKDTVNYEKKIYQMILQVLVDPTKCIINHRDTALAHLLTDPSSFQPYAVCLYPDTRHSHLSPARSVSPRL